MDLNLFPDSVPRGRIMTAARKRFEKFGYRATSVALIARDAGIAVGTVYLYFKNKEQILTALFEESDSRWMAEARALLRKAEAVNSASYEWRKRASNATSATSFSVR